MKQLTPVEAMYGNIMGIYESEGGLKRIDFVITRQFNDGKWLENK